MIQKQNNLAKQGMIHFFICPGKRRKKCVFPLYTSCWKILYFKNSYHSSKQFKKLALEVKTRIEICIYSFLFFAHP